MSDPLFWLTVGCLTGYFSLFHEYKPDNENKTVIRILCGMIFAFLLVIHLSSAWDWLNEPRWSGRSVGSKCYILLKGANGMTWEREVECR